MILDIYTATGTKKVLTVSKRKIGQFIGIMNVPVLSIYNYIDYFGKLADEMLSAGSQTYS